MSRQVGGGGSGEAVAGVFIMLANEAVYELALSGAMAETPCSTRTHALLLPPDDEQEQGAP